MIGVFSGAWLEPMAQVLRNLGSQTVWITHGGDGLDEMTTTGPTQHRRIAQRRNPLLRNYAGAIRPETRRRRPISKEATPSHNADALVGVLEGAENAYRDIALLNAAGALVVADKARELGEGLSLAAAALKSGEARRTLAKLVKVSND